MNINFKKYTIILFTLIVLGASGVFIVKDWVGTNRPKEEQEENKPLTIKVEKLGENSINIPTPDLNRKISVITNFSPESLIQMNNEIKKVRELLVSNPKIVENWIQLGIYYKTIGDYDGAIEVWEYAKALAPQNFIPYNNLGDLYAYFKKDAKKAEENFIKALELAPEQTFLYRSIYDFYLYIIKDEAKANEILKKAEELR